MTHEGDFILTHAYCDECVWSEHGFYNPMCCHCKYSTFSKRLEPNFMTRQMAEFLGKVKPIGEHEVGDEGE